MSPLAVQPPYARLPHKYRQCSTARHRTLGWPQQARNPRIATMSSTASDETKETQRHQQLPKDFVVAASGSAAGVWAGLTEVERTSLLVALARWHGAQQHAWPNREPSQALYTDPLGEWFVRSCIPYEEQQRMLHWAVQISRRAAVRTAELDAQIAAALGSSSSSSSSSSTGDAGPAAAVGGGNSPSLDTRQMVLLGAGTDTRAWRLPWSPGFKVFEVDSAAVLAFKARVLSQAAAAAAAAAAADGEQQGDAAAVLPQLQCKQRVEVAADASKPEELWSELVSSGLDASAPVLWLLDGFIGYLTIEASNALLSHLAAVSAPGSRIVMTAPPTPDMRREAAAASAADVTKVPAAAAAAAAAASDVAEIPPAAAAAARATAAEEFSPQLHHSTFEELTETLRRLAAAGWLRCELVTEQQLAAKYAVEHAQPILTGTV